jgi:hypothetical protein
LLIRRADRLRLEVHDRSRDLPRDQRPQLTDVSGRGFMIIDRLATCHGADLTPTGKAVWAEFDLACAPGAG